MKLIWSFSSEIGNYDYDIEWIFSIYEASMIRAKQLGHTVNFYGCQKSYEFLKHEINGEYIDVSGKDFKITDDLKIYIHTQEGLDACTIDGDIILHSKVVDIPNCDAWFDMRETRKDALHPNSRHMIGYLDMIDIFKKYPIKEEIFDEWDPMNFTSANVGFIKFNNQKMKDKVINTYYKLRDYYLEVIEPAEDLFDRTYPNDKNGIDPSLVICQYMIGCLSDHHNYNVYYAKAKGSGFLYKHYYGPLKWYDSTVEEINRIIDSKNSKSLL